MRLEQLQRIHSVAFRPAVLTAAAALLLACGGPPSSDGRRAVTVYGVAEIEVVPDHVVLTLRVRSLEEDLATSKARNDKALVRLVDALRGHEVVAEDIETGLVRVTQRFDGTRSGRVFKGYEVTRTIVVTLRQVAEYSTVLATCLDSGATHIDRVAFQTSELRMHRDAARAKAAGAAREKAEALAAELGASLGAALEIEEISGDWNPRYGGSLASNSIQVEGVSSMTDDAMNTGLVTVKSAVRVSFELQ